MLENSFCVIIHGHGGGAQWLGLLHKGVGKSREAVKGCFKAGNEYIWYFSVHWDMFIIKNSPNNPSIPMYPYNSLGPLYSGQMSVCPTVSVCPNYPCLIVPIYFRLYAMNKFYLCIVSLVVLRWIVKQINLLLSI